MQKDPKTNKWTYCYTFKVSKEKRREIETCAKNNHMTINKFIKDSIDMHLINLKQKPKKNDILKNQLELF